MKTFVEALCSDRAQGRAPGTPGGIYARGLVVDALRSAGVDPFEQPLPGCGGSNVLATIPGSLDRWILVAAHYDHLGVMGGEIYRGADDNAAAVAILVEVAHGLAAKRPEGRGVIIASFDAEEPPHFMQSTMGSQHYVHHPTVPLESIDLMICMDLVGHTLGSAEMPAPVRNTVFALGAERCEGMGEAVDELAEAESGVIVRRADAQIIPALSDYAAFWEQKRPFVFLTNGRAHTYHTPQDTPDLLDWPKMDATARWLERFVRTSCARPTEPFHFVPRTDDAATLRSMVAICRALAPASEMAQMGLEMAKKLEGSCDANGLLPDRHRSELQALVTGLESSLA